MLGARHPHWVGSALRPGRGQAPISKNRRPAKGPVLTERVGIGVIHAFCRFMARHFTSLVLGASASILDLRGALSVDFTFGFLVLGGSSSSRSSELGGYAQWRLG